MNITFFIGNGFDLNIGLKTRYQDFYKYLYNKSPDDKLVKSIKNNYELWADLESGLGEYLKNVNTDVEVEEFLDSKELIEDCLMQYLILENSCIGYPNKKQIAESFRNNIVGFYKFFSPKEQQHYKNLEGDTKQISYQFIDFNYTTVLDSLVSIAEKNLNPFSNHNYKGSAFSDYIVKPLHIHGDITGGMILGVNDISQINNEKLRNNADIVDCMLKKNLNEDAGCFRIKNAQAILDNSMYVCVYGMSIGDTDNMWWQSIISWLTQNNSRRLVLFLKDNAKVANSAGAQTRFSKKKRQMFTKHGIDVTEKVFNTISKQIIIIPNAPIFNIEGLSINRHEKIEITSSNNINNLFRDNIIDSAQQAVTKVAGKEKEIMSMTNNVTKLIKENNNG